MIRLFANHDEPPEPSERFFSVGVFGATLVVGELGGSSAYGGGVIAKGLKPDRFEDASLREKLFGFVYFDVFC